MLKQRILTALVLIPLLLVLVLWVPSVFALSFFAALILLGAWEWSAFLHTSRPGRWGYVALVGLLMAAAWYSTRHQAALEGWLIVACAWWAVALLWILLFPTRVSGVAATAAGLLVLVPAWIAVARLHTANDAGPKLTLFLLLLVWAADVGAYFTGRRLGRVKLAPRVSPGKTWEGVCGGFVASAVVALIGVGLFHLPALPFVMLCLAVSLVSIVGDLTESLFKRYAGLKDSGAVFPGHGGVLDRIDSVTAAAPFFVLGLGWLGLLR
jgi:phosphatidate cytidylyltransferase